MDAIFVKHATLPATNALLSHYAHTVLKHTPEEFVALFNPTRDQVRQFFCDTWQKSQNHQVLTPLELIASDWMQLHPEFHDALNHPEKSLQEDYTPERGNTNPFLHLSMHLSISEQISINQPPGIQAIAHQLSEKLGSEHEAQHRIMDSLGQVLWQAQRNGAGIDAEDYLEALRKLI